VLADLEAGANQKIEDHADAHHDRSGEIIEPWLTDQWFCNAAELAKPAIAAVESGRTQFVPRQWENTFFEWMRNIQPWCISRQLWWGHQIPAWYAPDGRLRAESEKEAARRRPRNSTPRAAPPRRGCARHLVLLGLWPFSTLGWPERPRAGTLLPGDVLVTGFDIIFSGSPA
jgi:valyl-tRNA synthetase